MTSTARAASTRVDISLEDRSYPILIGPGLLDRADAWDGLPRSNAAMIVTNTTVAPLYAKRLRAAIAARHRVVHEVVLPDGEVTTSFVP